jgi:hypothetical protein
VDECKPLAQGLPNEAYTWTDEQAKEHLAETNKQICAPVIRRCPRTAKKCKCSVGKPAAPYMAAVLQVRDLRRFKSWAA